MRLVSRAMVRRQMARELGGTRFKRGSEQRLACRDQTGLRPGQRGGTVVIEENVPVVLRLGPLAVLLYVGVPITVVNYDYTIRDLLRNRRVSVGKSTVAAIAMKDAQEEVRRRERMEELEYGFLDELRSMEKIWVPGSEVK